MPRKKKETIMEKVEEVVVKAAKKVGEEVSEIVKGTEELMEKGMEKVEEIVTGKEEPARKKITKEELEKKAKALAEKIEEKSTEEIKLKLESSRKMLVDSNDYVKSGIYIGTKVITPHLREFVYRRRNDGIAIMDINKTDKKLKEMIDLVCKYKPEEFIVICKREAGWKAVEKFSEITGVRIFTKKYPAGILTNIKLPDFFETEMVFVCDPWIDKNAMRDAQKIKKPVYALCDTNNYTFGVNEFVPCNNKSGKSIGIIFYILAREYVQKHKIEKEVKLEDFSEI